jgi:hypothetical protein
MWGVSRDCFLLQKQNRAALSAAWPAPEELGHGKLEFSRNVKERTGMKKSGYTEKQIIGILKQHEAGVKTADL